jgi:PTH1 family peptidyl-tRNA hydrolase
LRRFGAPVDWLIVGLGNPGPSYARTRHNVGFEVVAVVGERWDLGRAKAKFKGRLAEGRAFPGSPRVALLLPQTYMNESGRSVGPARGSLGVPLDRVLVVHDEIDLPFGRIEARMGGGLAGHNGLKSIAAEAGGKDFARVRVGVGRPESSDPQVVSAHVLGRFSESPSEVADLVSRAADVVEDVIAGRIEL